jgi:hypothetical protein
MIGAGDSVLGKKVAGERAQSPFHPVSNDGIADLLGDGDPDSLGCGLIAARPDLQDETGHGDPSAAIGRQEVRPFANRD